MQVQNNPSFAAVHVRVPHSKTAETVRVIDKAFAKLTDATYKLDNVSENTTQSEVWKWQGYKGNSSKIDNSMDNEFHNFLKKAGLDTWI